MKTFVTILKAVVTRVLFATHAFIAVWKLVDLKEGQAAYWYLVAPLMLQGFEGIVSICARNGEEMKWFCPSVFLYLVSVVPPIWLLELGLNDLRVNSTLEMKTSLSDVDKPCTGTRPVSYIQQQVKVLEQVLLVILLMGRWLLPKGKLTREQLSRLLLAYLAMAADVIELFECFQEEAVTRNVELIYATLAIWSWSLLQFTLVLSATHSPKLRPSINFPPPQEVTMLGSDLTTGPRMRRGTKTTCSYNLIMYLDMDILAILTTVLMQDGPFFLLRMTLIFGYKVVSHLNIFFTCKNTLIVSLQLYRLFVLCSQKRIINRKRKELLDEENSPVEGSEKEEDEKEEIEEEVSRDSSTDLPPPPLPPSGQDAAIDEALEASLLQIIEQVGEENIVKELENLVLANSEKEIQTDATSSLKNVSELMPVQKSRNTEYERSLEDTYYLPDSDLQHSSGAPVFPRQSTKKPHTAGIDCVRAEDYPSCCDVSDCPSFSDTDQTNDRFFDHQGVSVSSTSLAEPYINEIQQSRWPRLAEHFLPHYQHSQRGTSVPSSLRRDPRRKVSQAPSTLAFPHQNSFSPEPHRRLKRREGSTRSLCHVPGAASVWDFPHHRHSSYVQRSRYTGISESDAETLETNV
ncbi:transmembrane protein 26-like [Portunus trituberculatus]|uniref:Transmembrane protein 26 n=1 Tax=Portunus trituberculatus TaxID=210409 RepID=A0A5B7ESB0_PORTR|nr:transmembrane protein 26-like [Portunus trituberculatus]MPC37441.1 Transmembrane protein 26 [Portunus trituberculatus]